MQNETCVETEKEVPAIPVGQDGRYIYVVLARTPTILSWLLHKIKGDAYTHAALSLDKELRYMFTFGVRNCYRPYMACFKRESFRRDPFFRNQKIPGLVLELATTDAQYSAVVETLSQFLLNGHLYNYNYLGLFANLLGKNWQREYKFFCSEFVYYILNRCGISDLKMPRVFVRPQDLLKLGGKVVYEGDLKAYEKLDNDRRTTLILGFNQPYVQQRAALL